MCSILSLVSRNNHAYICPRSIPPFCAQVANLLNRYLGNYVEGLNRDSLRVAVWSGVMRACCATCVGESCFELDWVQGALHAGFHFIRINSRI